MDNTYLEIGKAVRLEYDADKDKLYIVFEVSDPSYRDFIKDQWINDNIEFEIINKSLVIKK
jgi:uncharacterized protein YuzE